MNETPNHSTHLGFLDGEVAGAWHRADPADVTDRRHWFSTYTRCFDGKGYGWERAVELGLSPAHDLHDSPTQWAYDRACEALAKHRKRADDLEAELAALRGGAR